MFSGGGYTMILGVLLALAFIMLGIHYVSKIFLNETKEILVRFILLIFSSLVCLFIVDKVIAFKIKLLSDEQNNQLFDLIKTLTLLIFSYYFGTQRGGEEKQQINKTSKK